MEIKNTKDLAFAFKQGKYSSVGSYPLYFLTSDGECLSWDAVKEDYSLIVDSINNGRDDGWRVIAHDVNWEDNEMYCAHNGQKIECAYAEQD